jgi:REP element-mobilizing transposase RayT
MAHAFANMLAHVIFGTKHRVPQIDPELKPRLTSYLGGVLRAQDVPLIEIDAMPDHVHLLISLPATKALADVLRVLKANSSKWVHETWAARRDFTWQKGYGSFSVSQSNVEAVRQYIRNQEEHHRKTTFHDEFIEFLRRHEIPFDERYLWE